MLEVFTGRTRIAVEDVELALRALSCVVRLHAGRIREIQDVFLLHFATSTTTACEEVTFSGISVGAVISAGRAQFSGTGGARRVHGRGWPPVPGAGCGSG